MTYKLTVNPYRNREEDRAKAQEIVDIVGTADNVDDLHRLAITWNNIFGDDLLHVVEDMGC